MRGRDLTDSSLAFDRYRPATGGAQACADRVVKMPARLGRIVLGKTKEVYEKVRGLRGLCGGREATPKCQPPPLPQ
jgi:hypothetical protein